MDADDEWMPTLLHNYYNVLSLNRDLVWCCAPYLMISENNRTEIRYFGMQLKNNIIENIFLAYKDFTQIVFAELISTCSVIIHRDVFNRVGNFKVDYKYGEDIDLWFRISLQYQRIGYVNDIGFKYIRTNINSLTKSVQTFENIKSQILRVNATWENHDLNNLKIIKYSKFIMNIWCWRILRSILKKRFFSLSKYFSNEIYDNLNARNKFILLIINLIIFKYNKFNLKR